jgi:hypothetical protein
MQLAANRRGPDYPQDYWYRCANVLQPASFDLLIVNYITATTAFALGERYSFNPQGPAIASLSIP